MVLIKGNLKATRDRQKSYANNRRKPLEFEIGEQVLLKVSPWKGVMRFGKKGKLEPRYVRPFEILERIGHVDYRLRFPKELSEVLFTYRDRRLSISEEALGAFSKANLQRTVYRGMWVRQRKGHFQNQCSKLVASRDNEVNIAARDSDDALVCCVKNMVNDRIMDSGASFHATYCKEELERFKLRSGKVRSVDDKTLDIAGVGDVVLKTSFGTIWTMKDDRIDMNMLASKGNVPDVRKVDIYFCKPGGLGKQKKLFFKNVREDKKTAEAATGVAHEEHGLLGSAGSKGSLWADLVSTTYLIYRIPYQLIGLRIPEEEWQGKDTSLTHLKLSGYEESPGYPSRDIIFVDSIYEAKSATYSSSLTKQLQKCQVVLVDIPENLVENYSLVEKHVLSLEITQSLGGSLDTSERSKNSGSFKDSGRSNEEYFKDGASSKEGGSKTPHVRRSTRESRASVSKESVQWKNAIIKEIVSLEKNQTCSLVRISAGKKLGKACSNIDKCRVFIFVGDSWNEEPCRDVHQVGDEREVEVLRNFNWPPSESITEDGLLPERGYSKFNDVSSGCLVSKVS
ncbi:hypothetical protein Tco_1448829 [Tanacetum coccineum]